MEQEDILKNLEFEFYAILAANPTWEKSLADFLISRHIKTEVVRNYCRYRGDENDDEECGLLPHADAASIP